MELLLFIAAVTLMALGLLELAATLSRMIWGRGRLKNCCVVLPVADGPEAELRLRAAWDGLRWSRLGPGLTVAVVDCCRDEEGSRICRTFCRDHGCFVVEPEQLPDILDTICKMERDVL